jgi:hypothetical protein
MTIRIYGWIMEAAGYRALPVEVRYSGKVWDEYRRFVQEVVDATKAVAETSGKAIEPWLLHAPS